MRSLAQALRAAQGIRTYVDASRMMMVRLAAVLLTGALVGCVGGDDGSDVDFRCFSSGAGAGLIGLDSLDMSGNPTVTGPYGSVFSNALVTLAGSYSLAGDAVSGGTVTISGNTQPGGEIIEEAGTITVTDPSAAVAAAKTSNANATIPCVTKGNKCTSPVSNGVLTIGSQETLKLAAGTYYFTGISMNGQAKLDVTGEVVIYLDGGATFNGGSAANPASNSLTVISKSTSEIKINGGGTTSMHIFAPFATVRFAGSQGFKGSALGKQMVISGTASLEVTRDLAVTDGTTTCTPAGNDDMPTGPLRDFAF